MLDMQFNKLKLHVHELNLLMMLVHLVQVLLPTCVLLK